MAVVPPDQFAIFQRGELALREACRAIGFFPSFAGYDSPYGPSTKSKLLSQFLAGYSQTPESQELVDFLIRMLAVSVTLTSGVMTRYVSSVFEIFFTATPFQVFNAIIGSVSVFVVYISMVKWRIPDPCHSNKPVDPLHVVSPMHMQADNPVPVGVAVSNTDWPALAKSSLHAPHFSIFRNLIILKSRNRSVNFQHKIFLCLDDSMRSYLWQW